MKNRLIACLMAAFLLVCNHSFGQTKSSPVAAWNFDEGSGNIAIDSSTNGNNGKLMNNAGWEGGALSLNGLNSYVNVPSKPWLKYQGGDMTMSAWIYPNTTEDSGGAIFSKPWNDGDQYNYCLYYTADRRIYFFLGGNGNVGCLTPGPLENETWYYVVATVNEAGLMKIYVDGVEEVAGNNTIADWMPPNGDQDNPLAIGSVYPHNAGWLGDNRRVFDGLIVRAEIYDFVLSAQEIKRRSDPFSAPSYQASFSRKVLDNAPTSASRPGVDSTKGAGVAAAGISGNVIANEAALSFLPVQAATHIEDMKRAFWKFDETSGMTARDASGNANAGLLRNGASWTSSGKEGGAVKLNGLNSYVEIPPAEMLKYRGGDMTLSVWIKPDAGETNCGTIFSKPWNGLGQYNYFLACSSGRQIVFGLTGNNAVELRTINAVSPIVWHHIAAVVNSDSEMRVYIDGVEAAAGVHNISDWSPSAGDKNRPLAIGTLYPYGQGWGGNSLLSFNGKIDDAVIYYRALSAQEIGQISSGMKGAWNFGEGSGNTAGDSSLNLNHGLLQNGIGWMAEGYDGSGLRLNGMNGYVEAPASISIASNLPAYAAYEALKYRGGDMTLSVWIKPDVNETNAGHIISKPWNSSYAYNYYLQYRKNQSILFWLSGSDDAYAFLDPTNVVPAGVWHHIAATVDSTRMMSLYVDGIEQKSRVHNISNWTPSKGDMDVPLVVGGFYPKGPYNYSTLFFGGAIDDVMLYNSALSAQKIMLIADQTQGYWGFDDANGSIARDSTVNARHGLLRNGVAWATNGKDGGALNVLKLNGLNGYVEVASSPALEYKGREMTLCCWIKPDAGETNCGTIFSKPWNGLGQMNYYIFYNRSGQIYFGLGGAGSAELRTQKSASRGAWHHIAATVDSSGLMKIYIDGIEEASYVHPIIDWTPGNGNLNRPLAIGTFYPYGGNWGGNITNSFSGMIDNAAIYSRALSAEKIGQIFSDSTATSRKFVFAPRYLPYHNKVWIDELNIAPYERSRDVACAVFSIERSGQMLFSKRIYLEEELTRNIEVRLTANVITDNGQYHFICRLIDDKSRTLATEDYLYDWTNFPFVHTDAGKQIAVLPPFTPLEYQNGVVSALAARYEFDNLGLLTSIVSRQTEPTVGAEVEEILAAPARFIINGQSVVASGNLTLLQATPQRVMLSGDGAAGDVPVKLTAKIDYDGLIWMELELTPSATTIDDLTLELPLRPSQATLFYEMSLFDLRTNCTSGSLSPSNGVLWTSMEHPNRLRKDFGDFKPALWVGNEDRGLTWCAESGRWWNLDETKPALEIVRQDGQVKMLVHFINKPLNIDAPRTIAFGLQATPVKPLPARWRSWQIVVKEGLTNLSNFYYYAWNNPILHANNFVTPYPSDYAAAQLIMNPFRQDNGIFLLYQAIDAVEQGKYSHSTPEFKAFAGEWDKIWMSSYTESFNDFKAWAYDRSLKEMGFFTVYEDEALLRPMIDPALNAGYLRTDGNYQPEFGILGLREAVRRNVSVWLENNMPNMYGLHKAAYPLAPCNSFAAMTIDGELRTQKKPAPDYIDNFPLDFIRAFAMGRQFGAVPVFLEGIYFTAAQYGEEALIKANRAFFSLMLLHDIIAWHAWGSHRPTVNVVHTALNDFNIGDADVRFYPYWGIGQYSVTQSSAATVKTSLWKRPGIILAVVANTGEERVATVTFDLAKLNFNPRSVVDYESGETFILTNGAVTLTLPRHDFKLIVLSESETPPLKYPVSYPSATVRYENNQLIVNVGRIKACFNPNASWTLCDARCGDRDWLPPTGFMQSVLYEDFAEGALPDHFLGSGHRPETIDSVTIRVMRNGAEIKSGNAAGFSFDGKADAVIVEKKSKFISEIGGFLLDHVSQVFISVDGIKEQFHYMGGDGNLTKVSYMYPFMHNFSNSTKYWIAGGDNGGIIEEGIFKDDNTFTLKKQCRWVVIMDPVIGLGTVYCYPETYAGKDMFWNRPYDNKLYFTTDCVKNQGEEISYEVTLRPFNADETDWRNKAQELLRTAFGISGANLEM